MSDNRKFSHSSRLLHIWKRLTWTFLYQFSFLFWFWEWATELQFLKFLLFLKL